MSVSSHLLSNKYTDKLYLAVRKNGKYVNGGNSSSRILGNAYLNKLEVNKLAILDYKQTQRLAFFFMFYLNNVNLYIINNKIDVQINTFDKSIVSEFVDRPIAYSYKSDNARINRIVTNILFDPNLSILFRIKDLSRVQFVLVISGKTYVLKFLTIDKTISKLSFEIIEIDGVKVPKDRFGTTIINNVSVQLISTSIRIEVDNDEYSSFIESVLERDDLGLTEEDKEYINSKMQEVQIV